MNGDVIILLGSAPYFARGECDIAVYLLFEFSLRFKEARRLCRELVWHARRESLGEGQYF